MSDTEATWYVATAWFKDGGKWISGPYTTREDAITARTTIEKMSRSEGAYCVDSQKYGHSAPVVAGGEQKL